MKLVYKKSIAVFLSLVLILTLFIPMASFAAQGTLGSESPHLYCSFTDSESNATVDGNTLTAGTYDVSFYLSGMAAIATLELNAAYDEAALSVNGFSDLLCNTVENMKGLGGDGVLIANGTVACGFITRVETGATCTPIDAQGQLLFRLNVTVTSESAVDFADLFVLNTHPQVTFIEADYGDYPDYGASDQACYALVESAEDYDAALYRMTADLSPASGYSVTGKVLALASANGRLAGDDCSVRECDVLIDGAVVATTNDDGVFTIPALAAGTYTATLSYAYGYDREITITVTDGAVDLGRLGMVVCNFGKDTRIDGTDYNTYKRASGKSGDDAAYNPYCDFNHDGSVNGTDYNIYKAFSGKSLTQAVYG